MKPVAHIDSLAWPAGLGEILRELGADFGGIEMRGAEYLLDARQTGFVWTRRQGIVCLAANRQYLAHACANDDVRVIIAPPTTAAEAKPEGKALIACERAEELYLYLHMMQQAETGSLTPEIDSSARIDNSAVLRGDVRVGPHVSIGPHASVCGPVRIARDTCIEAGAIVGCEGLYAKEVRGRRQHIPHFGGVDIGASVFIHAGAVIARSAIHGEATLIGQAAHIGIAANIGHDAVIGEAATLSSHCVIAGRAHIGARAWIGASATVSNAVRIGNEARVRLGAVVIRNVPDGADVSGNFAEPHAGHMRRFLKETSS
jgi:UDP-3-O-[3-hydroxymyristoyl] glucosamine N-acyltransferase